MGQSLSLKTQNTLQSRERCETRSSPPHPLAPSHLAPSPSHHVFRSPPRSLAPSHLAPRTSHLDPRTPNPAPRTPNLAPRTPNLAPRTSNLAPRTSNPEPRTFAQSPSPPVSKSLRNSNNFTIFIETADFIIPFLFSD